MMVYVLIIFSLLSCSPSSFCQIKTRQNKCICNGDWIMWSWYHTLFLVTPSTRGRSSFGCITVLRILKLSMWVVSKRRISKLKASMCFFSSVCLTYTYISRCRFKSLLLDNGFNVILHILEPASNMWVRRMIDIITLPNDQQAIRTSGA